MTTYNQDGTPMSGGGSNQLLDLIAIVTNPEAYTAKLKVLQDAISEHKKLIDVVGPAKDIVELREKAASSAAEASAALAQAKVDAVNLVSEAKVQAKELSKVAQGKANDILAKAKAVDAEVQGKLAELEKSLGGAAALQNTANAKVVEYDAKLQKLEDAQAKLALDKAEIAAGKAALLAKHKAFIESL